MALHGRDELVIEFDRAMRKATKDGAKSDALDAIRAAREALGRDKLNQPRAHDGIREAICVHTVARAAAVRAQTAAVNELKAFIVAADEQLRAELRWLRTNKIVTRCSRFRDSAARPIDAGCTRNAMRALVRRVQHPRSRNRRPRRRPQNAHRPSSPTTDR
jgi:transposase